MTDATSQKLDFALDLMRRLPPQQIEKNLTNLIDLVPNLCEDLLSAIDQPLKVARDKKVGKDYLLCDYNRDGDSYRSPWSNVYDPPFEDGIQPSDRWNPNQGFVLFGFYRSGKMSSEYMKKEIILLGKLVLR